MPDGGAGQARVDQFHDPGGDRGTVELGQRDRAERRDDVLTHDGGVARAGRGLQLHLPGEPGLRVLAQRAATGPGVHIGAGLGRSGFRRGAAARAGPASSSPAGYHLGPAAALPRPGRRDLVGATAAARHGRALARQLGPARADLLRPLAEPTATVELARRLRVTPSAVSQHLQVLHASGLVTRARAGRQVLYRRSPLGDQLSDGVTAPLRP